jgi:hypothetical protein
MRCAPELSLAPPLDASFGDPAYYRILVIFRRHERQEIRKMTKHGEMRSWRG